MYAMKVLEKASVVDKDEYQHTLNEAGVLKTIEHPFLVGLQESFQDANNLYFVMDLAEGGDLLKHWNEQGRVSPKQT